MLRKELSEICCCSQPSDDRGTRKCMNTARVFPKIPARGRQPCGLISERQHKVGTPDNQQVVKPMCKIDVAMGFIVFPKCPKNKCCLVFLDRNEFMAGQCVPFRMPAGCDSAVRIVLLTKITFSIDDLAAEMKERTRHFRITRIVKRSGHKCAVSRP